MEALNELCKSDNLSLTALREKISNLSILAGDITQETYDYNEHPFLHSLCINWNVTVTLEM